MVRPDTYMKHLILFLFSGLALAQSGSVSTFNFGSQSPLRAVMPIQNVPPCVEVWIYDPSGADGYVITLNYRGTDGVSHSITQYASSSGTNTAVIVQVDAISIDSVKAPAVKFTGVSYSQP